MIDGLKRIVMLTHLATENQPKLRVSQLIMKTANLKRAICWLLSIGTLFYATLSWASIEAIYGDWEGGGSGTEAIFGTMTITKTRLTWKGKSHGEPRCTVNYQLIPEGFGVRFHDAAGHEFVSAPDSQFQTFLLEISGRKRCAMGITHFRMTLRRDLPVSVLEEVDYQGLDNPMGWVNRPGFSRHSEAG